MIRILWYLLVNAGWLWSGDAQVWIILVNDDGLIMVDRWWVCLWWIPTSGWLGLTGSVSNRMKITMIRYKYGVFHGDCTSKAKDTNKQQLGWLLYGKSRYYQHLLWMSLLNSQDRGKAQGPLAVLFALDRMTVTCHKCFTKTVMTTDISWDVKYVMCMQCWCHCFVEASKYTHVWV